jgi:AraC-like DNA-binding protein
MDQNKRFPGWGSSQVAIMLDFARQEGLSVEASLKDSGISEQSLMHEDPSLAQELVVINNLIHSLDHYHPFLMGYRVGRMANLHTFGLIGQALVSSSTLCELTSLVKAYFNGKHHFLKIQSKLSDRKILTNFEIPEYLTLKEAQFNIGRGMGATISIQEGAVDDFLASMPIVEIGFTSEKLPGMDEIASYCGCDMRFGQSMNYMLNHVKVQNLSLPLGNTFLFKMLNQRLQRFLTDSVQAVDGRESMREQIRALLENFGYEDMGREQMARRLNVSSRTLARYLHSEGTNWRSLYTQMRMEKARQLLSETNHSIEVIAESVGFSSTSSFSSAFSRENGQSPYEFRNAWKTA